MSSYQQIQELIKDLEGNVTLTGSDAQIKWAKQIRADFAVKAYKLIKRNTGLGGEDYWQRLEVNTNKLFSIQSAKFWIDNRNETIEKALGNAKKI